jgi:hypothetical protein
MVPKLLDGPMGPCNADNKSAGEAMRWAIIRLDEARRHLMEAGVRDEAVEMMRIRARVTRRRISMLTERANNGL